MAERSVRRRDEADNNRDPRDHVIRVASRRANSMVARSVSSYEAGYTTAADSLSQGAEERV
jgi:hypothetical protein